MAEDELAWPAGKAGAGITINRTIKSMAYRISWQFEHEVRVLIKSLNFKVLNYFRLSGSAPA